MSADNWALCPRCLARAQAAAAKELEAVMALYGSVPIEEFDAKRAAFKPVNPNDFRTFREDYEFWGAEEGTVQATYSGECSACGLGVSLEASKTFWSRGDGHMNTHANTVGTDAVSKEFGQETGLWYCPVCGYIDPKTRNTRCPRPHAPGIANPLFVQAVYGYFLRIGPEEARNVAQRSVPAQDVRGDYPTTTEALRLIAAALGPLSGDMTNDGRRVYLAYIAAVNALAPLPSRTLEIAQLRERLLGDDG